MDFVKVIPCMDVKDGRVVKGIKFVDFKDAGDPAEAAAYYTAEGADELVFLDIAATPENRETLYGLLERTAKRTGVPLCVGGGIRSCGDFERALAAGASMASVNSAAVANPGLIEEASKKFGRDKVCVAIDAKRENGAFKVCVNAGLSVTQLDAVSWAREAEKLGAGSILLTSFDADGTKDGYDIELTKAVSSAVSVPVTASGGAGRLEHFYEAVASGGASAVLAASLFHFREVAIAQVKEYLKSKGIPVYEKGVI